MRDQQSGLRSLLVYLRPHRTTVVVLVALMLPATALPLLVPQLLRRFVDQAADGLPTRVLVGTAFALLLISVTGQLIRVVTSYIANRLAWSATNALREDLFAHVLGLDLAFHGTRTSGELIERVDGDVSSLSELVSRFVFEMASNALLLVGAIVLVGREDLRLGSLLALMVVGIGIVIERVQRRSTPFARAEREAEAQVTGFIEERLAGVEDLRALDASDHTLDRFLEASSAAFRANFTWEARSGVLLAGVSVLFGLATSVVLAGAVVLLRNETITVGTTILLLQYTSLVRRPISQLSQQVKELQRAVAGAGRIVDLLGEGPSLVDPDDGGSALPSAGPLEVRLDRVTFAYEGDEPVLRDVSLELAAGRSLGLVGRTGSGKTTIARLLLRLYDPTQGAVLLNGCDLREVAGDSRRSRIRLVTQDVQLFGASLRDNLTMFSPGHDDRRLVEVIHDLGLASWFADLPEGLDSRVGPGGAGMSAGEAQLLAFARVHLGDPGLVVLDEASSRLDPATEFLIERALDRLLLGRTAVLIAHRLASLDRVDDIAVVHQGRIVEHGARTALAADPTSRFGQLLGMAATP